ncbi:MAG: rhodanese-like domain-containing protein, partial [Planctomycetes bacterium]|nr:rhodanese-like domain-containing protein [Planctomycetota bacterium]
MTHGSPFPRRVLAALILVLALVPVVTWWLLIGRAPGLPAAAARERIRSGDPPAVLVDVRAPAEFAAGHVAGAVNWPFAELARIAGPAEVPAPLRDRELLLLCDSGIHGAAAARHLAPMLGDRVASVRDGMRGWIAEDAVAGPTALAALQGGVAVPLPAPWRESPAHEQWAAVLTGFVVKPIYMLMALLGIVVLWRSAAADLVALRWGLILFLAGESACAINYLLFRDGSHLSEYLHSLGMVLAFGFVTHALMEGLDHRFVHYSEPDQRCAAIKLCQTCFKYKPVPCGLQRLFLVAIPATAVLAGLPLLSPLRASAYNTR